MQIGKVKWFNNAKGYGFILPDEGGGDLFAHYSAISMNGYKTLKAGQVVQFETITGPKGLHAVNIQPLSHGTPTVDLEIDGSVGTNHDNPDNHTPDAPSAARARHS